MLRTLTYLLLSFLVVALTACSNEGESNKDKDPPWKTQVQAIDKAKEVNRQLEEAAKHQREAIEKQTQ